METMNYGLSGIEKSIRDNEESRAIMAKKRVTLSEQIRQAVNDSGMSRYAICKKIGIQKSSMSRFMNGQGGLQLNNLDALSDLLKLNLKPKLKAGAKSDTASALDALPKAPGVGVGEVLSPRLMMLLARHSDPRLTMQRYSRVSICARKTRDCIARRGFDRRRPRRLSCSAYDSGR